MSIFRMFLVAVMTCLLTMYCKKKEVKKPDPCKEVSELINGSYLVTVKSYPRQPSQEGEQKDVLVFFMPWNCYNNLDTDKISFNNLFEYFGCTSDLKLINGTFTIEYKDGHDWLAAPIKGEGFVKGGFFYFSGTILSSQGEFPIVLTGVKTSSQRRTNAC